MANIRGKALFGSATFALAIGIAGGASPAFAQDTTPPAPAAGNEQTIVITGSRIRRDPLDQAQPVTFVDRADLDRTGLTSTAEALQRLPSSGGALNSRFNNSGNFGNPPDGGGVGAGAAEVDLRYLGSRRVLVLVDGLRYVRQPLYLREGRTEEVKRLAEAMLPIFTAADVHREALAALIIFVEAAKQEQLTIALTRDIGKYLRDARVDPSLRFAKEKVSPSAASPAGLVVRPCSTQKRLWLCVAGRSLLVLPSWGRSGA